MVKSNAREDAIAAVRTWQETIAHWEAEVIAAGAELQDLRARMGEEILENPSSRDAIAGALQKAERNEEVAISAAAAAAPKLLAAQHAVLEGDAVVFDEQASTLRARLGKHQARTAELLEQLRQHEGEFVPAPAVVGGQLAEPSPTLAASTQSAEIERSIAQAELKAQVLRTVIAGGDPNALLAPHRSYIDGTILGLEREEYFSPAVWGPGAIVLGSDFAARVAAKRQAIIDHDATTFDPAARIAGLEVEIAEAEAKVAARIRRGQDADRYDLENLKAVLAETIAKRDNAPAVRAALVAELEALTGQPDSVDA